MRTFVCFKFNIFIPMQQEGYVDPLRERLRAEMARRRLSPLELSKRACVGRSFIYDMLSGKSCNPTAKKIRAVADVLQVSVPYLIHGEAAAGDLASNLETYAGLTFLEPEKDGDFEYYIPKAWLKMPTASSATLRVCRMASDEMEPTLKQDDILLLDVASGAAFSAGIYAVSDGGRTFIRRLDCIFEEGKRTYFVRADNAGYPSYSVPCGDLSIVGKVVWRCGLI